ncbi:hypothetical protein K435DRAFT_861679 [Dendrothele bispora CBS 962.96]|uniref:Uncharacterized protein n=1 Tax=Dendrothele bispora (strain CBS 962.96) TaxID=1314807 RepID=A0A4S8LUG1_DENBC|nr:hypothetical protein K435DRAFT_863498 [Dendrothele bispora CBS 962.96]THU93219.1 hypothetical protein K435DRAFT_861679 [Dendrothele bispora CBS 962.96]
MIENSRTTVNLSSPRLNLSYAQVLHQNPSKTQPTCPITNEDSLEIPVRISGSTEEPVELKTIKYEESDFFNDENVPSTGLVSRSFKQHASGGSNISSSGPSSLGDRSFQSITRNRGIDEHEGEDDGEGSNDNGNDADDKENLAFPNHPEPASSTLSSNAEESDVEHKVDISLGLANPLPDKESRMPLNDITAAFEGFSMTDSSVNLKTPQSKDDNKAVDISSTAETPSTEASNEPSELCWVSLTDPNAPVTTRSTDTNTYVVRRSVIQNLPQLLDKYADLRAYPTRNAMFWARARAYEARDRYVMETYNEDGTRKVPRVVEVELVPKPVKQEVEGDWEEDWNEYEYFDEDDEELELEELEEQIQEQNEDEQTRNSVPSANGIPTTFSCPNSVPWYYVPYPQVHVGLVNGGQVQNSYAPNLYPSTSLPNPTAPRFSVNHGPRVSNPVSSNNEVYINLWYPWHRGMGRR